VGFVSVFMATGRLNTARSEAEYAKTAVLVYYADHGTWPTVGGELDLVSGNYLGAAADGEYDWTAAGVISGVNNSYGGMFTWHANELHY
jgi:hypothetical protein